MYSRESVPQCRLLPKNCRNSSRCLESLEVGASGVVYERRQYPAVRFQRDVAMSCDGPVRLVWRIEVRFVKLRYGIFQLSAETIHVSISCVAIVVQKLTGLVVRVCRKHDIACLVLVSLQQIRHCTG